MLAQVSRRIAVLVALALLLTALPSAGQTSGTVAGTVKDSQGGVLPGATIVLTSETRGTTQSPVITNSEGDFVIPNATVDRYTVEVTMTGFKTLTRRGVAVSGGDRVALGTLVLELGTLSETVEVTAEAAVIQTQSGERSFTVVPESVQNLPIAGRSFTTLVSLAPGVTPPANPANPGTPTRTGGGGSTQMSLDGVTTMDTGSNGILLQLNVEAIAEVKVVTSGYQAEFGRASGLQLVAVSRSGSNRFRGSVYDIKRNSDWNSRTWQQRVNNQPKTISKEDDWGYSIGGPIGRPGGANRLFFFYSHEYRPRTTGGIDRNFRVPTALEINGDFSQTRDQNGQLMPWIKDPLMAAGTCVPTAAGNHSGCFQDGGVMGRIPQSRLAELPAYGKQILMNMYQASLAFGGPGTGTPTAAGANLFFPSPTTKTRVQQPLVRIDYQPSQDLRVSFRYASEFDKKQVTPGTLPGWNDTFNPHPGNSVLTLSSTVNYTLNNTTFIEGTWGYNTNYIAGLPVSDRLDRVGTGINLPLIYPNAMQIDPRYHAFELLEANSIPGYHNGLVTLLPSMTFGGRVANALPTPNLGLLNTNKTFDLSVSLTKVMGQHTIKAGFFENHSFKAQNAANPNQTNAQGTIVFSNNEANNPFDTNFPFSNALFGVFDSYSQLNKYIEGSYISNNTEAFIQDNWKMTPKLTLDFGLRFVHQQPQYDQFGQASNFLPDQWSLANAPAIYGAGCPGTAVTCAAAQRVAVLPDGTKLGTGSGILIGNVVPNTGNIANGIKAAGDGIPKYTYDWPFLMVSPRFGAAYDLSGNQTIVIRGGGGIFYDRPSGNTLFGGSGISSNPPLVQQTTHRFGMLQDLQNPSFTVLGAPALSVFELESKVPSSAQWNVGTQLTLPWASALDVSYVGQHSYNQLQNVNLNTIDLGAAFNPAYNDPTVAVTAATAAGSNSYVTTAPNMLRAYRGYGAINQQWARGSNTYHSLQVSFNRRFSRGLAFGLNDTIGLYDKGTVAPRLEHAADGTLRIRADQAEADRLLGDNGVRRHIIKGNFVWDMPDYANAAGGLQRVVGLLVSDWQLSGVFTGGTAAAFTPTFTYQGLNVNTNLTGSPDYNARVVITGDPGSGCSSNPFKQFNTAAFTGAQIGSVGLESGNNVLRGCADHRFDMAIARNIRFGGSRSLQLRIDAFNVFNSVIYSDRVSVLQLQSPTNQTVLNSQYLADGSVDPARVATGQRGFGAATNAFALRTVQLQIRFEF